MKAVKSIFDKSYIVKAQAEAAGAKEWPQGIPCDVALSRDEATKKFRFIKTLHPALAAAELEMPANVDLGQALAESGESLADLKDGDRIANATMAPAFVVSENCPHCGIHLSNGLMDFNSLHDQHGAKAYELQKLEYACMGCGGEFGPAIGAKAERPRLSSVIRPTKMVWDIADSMPKASRKEVMEACVNAGIAYGTSRTQYQAWFKASQEAKRVDIRQPYEKGEK